MYTLAFRCMSAIYSFPVRDRQTTAHFFYHDMRLIDVTHEVPTSLLFVFSPLLLFDVRVFQCKFAAARVCFLSSHFLGKLDLLPMQAPIYTLAFRCMPVFFRRVSRESSTFCRRRHLS